MQGVLPGERLMIPCRENIAMVRATFQQPLQLRGDLLVGQLCGDFQAEQRAVVIVSRRESSAFSRGVERSDTPGIMASPLECFPIGNHQSCSVMIPYGNISALARFPSVSLRSTNGYIGIIP